MSGRAGVEESKRLMRFLMHRYSPELIPHEAGEDNVLTVKFVVMLYDVLSLDPETGRLNVQLHIQLVGKA